ncbi:MAG: DNA-3-methyladenine glycosylase 2 family protein, partial [Mycobacterium sp.]
MRRSASVVFAGPASPGLTLSPLRRGKGDPCYHEGADGAIWRTTLLGSG